MLVFARQHNKNASA